MADTDVLPYDYVNYGHEIAQYLADARKKAQDNGLSLRFGAADIAAGQFISAATAVKQRQDHPSGDESVLNTALRQTEEDLLSEKGLPNRPWYKHTIYAPGEYTGYAAVVIPGVNEAIDAKDADRAQSQLDVLTSALNRATATLETAK